jgi:hypothetical protein
MPRISNNAKDEDSLVAEAIERSVKLMPGVQFYAGVSRKANVGNYETIDVYSGICLPIGLDVDLTEEGLRLIASEAADIGFSIVSAETWDRYSLIKEMQAK